jgi:hypothetical protein|tara:strand:- start:690 stop:851 length:162 start_codon:yes stop_codon:yes gene_type:complete
MRIYYKSRYLKFHVEEKNKIPLAINEFQGLFSVPRGQGDVVGVHQYWEDAGSN